MRDPHLEEVFRTYIHSLLTGEAASGEHQKHLEEVRHRLKRAGYLSTPDPRSIGIIPSEPPRRALRACPLPVAPQTQEAPPAESAGRVGAHDNKDHSLLTLFSALLLTLLIVGVWYLPLHDLPALHPIVGGPR